VLQELLFCFKVAKRFTNKLIVFAGWNDALPTEHSKKFTDFLNDSNIIFINESLLSYTKRNGLPVLPDGTHPDEAAYVSYADNMIVPLIKQLGWL
jgi:lysophospholipase L1-like esterase